MGDPVNTELSYENPIGQLGLISGSLMWTYWVGTGVVHPGCDRIYADVERLEWKALDITRSRRQIDQASHPEG
jgi:hypothetical protein